MSNANATTDAEDNEQGDDAAPADTKAKPSSKQAKEADRPPEPPRPPSPGRVVLAAPPERKITVVSFARHQNLAGSQANEGSGDIPSWIHNRDGHTKWTPSHDPYGIRFTHNVSGCSTLVPWPQVSSVTYAAPAGWVSPGAKS